MLDYSGVASAKTFFFSIMMNFITTAQGWFFALTYTRKALYIYREKAAKKFNPCNYTTYYINFPQQNIMGRKSISINSVKLLFSDSTAVVGSKKVKNTPTMCFAQIMFTKDSYDKHVISLNMQ